MKKQGKIALFALSVAFIFGLTCLLLSVYLPKASKSNGIMLGSSNNAKIKMSSIVLEDDEFGAISSSAVAGVEVTAEITPADAYVSSVAWSVAWVDETATETVSDYITLHEDESNKLVVTVIVEQAFGTQAQLKIAVTDCFGTEKTATCSLDYIARVTGLTGYAATDFGDLFVDGSSNFGAVYYDLDAHRFNGITGKFGTGSVEDTFVIDGYTLEINPEALDTLNYVLGTECSGKYEYAEENGVILPFRTFFDTVCDYANRSDEQKVAFSEQYFGSTPLIVWTIKGHGEKTNEVYSFSVNLYVSNNDTSFLEGVASIESVTLGDDIVI